MDKKKQHEIYEALQGITYIEWKKLRHSIDRSFETEAARQENKIEIAAPEKLNEMYRLTIDEIIEHCNRKTEMYEKVYDIKYLETATMNNPIKEYWEHKQVAEYLRKLKAYEDLEEQGRLVILPCKMGDVVYRINRGAMKPVIPLRVVEYRFKIVGNYIREKICCSDDFLCKQPSIIYYTEDIGKTVFLTKSEAEAKLKEFI